MSITKKQQKLLDDAKAAGFTVGINWGGKIDIFKQNRFGQINQGITIYPDGSGFDLMARIDQAKVLRTDAQKRGVLGLT